MYMIMANMDRANSSFFLFKVNTDFTGADLRGASLEDTSMGWSVVEGCQRSWSIL